MVHDWVGGDMGIVLNSAFDPIFYMHHAYIDYIFEEFRNHQKQAERCKYIDLESDYRPMNDLCQKCSDTDTRGHGPDDTMVGYNHIRNIDGLWLNWTTEFYNYEPRPSCPHNCSGKYLYCDKSFDASKYPDGICVTRTKSAATCNNLRVKRDTKSLTPSISCDRPGNKFEVLHGDGRNRRMSVKTALEKLKLFATSFLGTKKSTEKAENESRPCITGIIFGIGFGIETVVIIALIAYICLKYAQLSGGGQYITTSTQDAL
ncbi:putative tyrosinase-like protein tyr-3 [Mercenaria mercenaria]|uniref:putative tyrosinase-like protein tyr-3 n=1 Tax=Mercenaria mercenaria TaxID=6596 RepID=UPI00234F2D93|nr:putative tyrosinase-like protein tyr-3 [Mercenaria mercenaria]